MIDIRDNVKVCCKAKGATQKILAKKMGISETSLNVSLGRSNPRLSTLIAIAEALGVTVADLVSDHPLQDKPQPETREVSYLRCPCCGNKIELFSRPMDIPSQDNAKDTKDAEPQPREEI